MNTLDPSTIKMFVPAEENPLLQKVLGIVNSHEELKALWKIINVNAIDRLGFSDHGHVHFQIVANIALKMSRMLKNGSVEMSLTKDYGFSYEHSEVVIFLASVLHDTGMSVHRDGHEEFSVVLANRLLHEILDFMPVYERTVMISETLHAIISHRAGGKPLTLEAGIVRVADALDMSDGRIRVAMEKGHYQIHSISAAAINKIEIQKGTDKLIKILIDMNNSAGIFQVDDLLDSKLGGSGLEQYVSIEAHIKGEEKKLLIEPLIR